MSEWLYKGTPVIDPPEKSVGFVYDITNNVTGRRYIGKKFLKSHRTKKVAGRKNRKHVIKESDWRIYFGSNEFLIEDVKTLGEDKFTREILAFYNMKKDITYSETEQQFKMDVLRAKLPNGKPAYYNRNILGKFFPPKEK
jgi:ribosomal protein S8E